MVADDNPQFDLSRTPDITLTMSAWHHIVTYVSMTSLPCLLNQFGDNNLPLEMPECYAM